MDQKKALTGDELRLTAAYLNMNEEGRALLDTVTEQLAETEQEKRERGEVGREQIKEKD